TNMLASMNTARSGFRNLGMTSSNRNPKTGLNSSPAVMPSAISGASPIRVGSNGMRMPSRQALRRAGVDEPRRRQKSHLAGNQVGDGDQVPSGAIAAGADLGCLDQRKVVQG